MGLVANTKLLKSLIDLNVYGEVVTKGDQSTSLDGFFAAGDVTDVKEKQILIAAGQGTLAALSTYKYLQEKR